MSQIVQGVIALLATSTRPRRRSSFFLLLSSFFFLRSSFFFLRPVSGPSASKHFLPIDHERQRRAVRLVNDGVDQEPGVTGIRGRGMITSFTQGRWLLAAGKAR
jgi:hypothetical protein